MSRSWGSIREQISDNQMTRELSKEELVWSIFFVEQRKPMKLTRKKIHVMPISSAKKIEVHRCIIGIDILTDCFQ